MNGFEFTKILSNDLSLKHIPIIFLSAKSGKADRLQGLQLGAIDFIQKPFNINELLQKVESFLMNSGKQKQALMTSAFNNLNTQGALSPKNVNDIFENNCEKYKLTLREKDIAQLICKGTTYKAISTDLFIAERTVTTHVQNIFHKLEVSNKIEMTNKLEC